MPVERLGFSIISLPHTQFCQHVQSGSIALLPNRWRALPELQQLLYQSLRLCIITFCKIELRQIGTDGSIQWSVFAELSQTKAERGNQEEFRRFKVSTAHVEGGQVIHARDDSCMPSSQYPGLKFQHLSERLDSLTMVSLLLIEHSQVTQTGSIVRMVNSQSRLEKITRLLKMLLRIMVIPYTHLHAGKVIQAASKAYTIFSEGRTGKITCLFSRLQCLTVPSLSVQEINVVTLLFVLPPLAAETIKKIFNIWRVNLPVPQQPEEQEYNGYQTNCRPE